MSLLRIWSCKTEQALNHLLKAQSPSSKSGFFPRRRLKCLVAGSTTCLPACAGETSNARVGGTVGRFQKGIVGKACRSYLASDSRQVQCNSTHTHSFSSLTSSTKTHLRNIVRMRDSNGTQILNQNSK